MVNRKRDRHDLSSDINLIFKRTSLFQSMPRSEEKMMKPIHDDSKMIVCGGKGTFSLLRRNRMFTKVLPLAVLAFFVYNSFENPSIEIYRQLNEAAENRALEETGKVDGKFKYCKTPYVLMGNLLTTVPQVIPPHQRMDPPSHIQLCKALLDRVDLDKDALESASTMIVKEDPAVCVDWSAPHHSVLSIFASSLIASKGLEYKLGYSHECHKFLTHTREGNTRYDYTTVQEVLPENLISALDAESVDLGLVKDLCHGCISHHETSQLSTYDGATHHCFLFPGGATAENLVKDELELPLSSIISSFVDRMRHMTEDWIGATNAIKHEDKSGVIVSLDEKSSFMDFPYYDGAIPFPPSSIQIFASANCAVASIHKKSDCIEHGRALKAYFKSKYPTSYVRYDIVASTATSFARMMDAKTLICPPGTVMCLLPALGKLAGKKAIIAEDGTRPATFHWFDSLLEKRKKLGLYQIGFDPVDDEDFLVISQETSTEMPADLPREDMDTEDDESISDEPNDAPFDLPLEHLLDIDTIAPPNEYDATNDQSLERSSESNVETNDEPHVKDFKSLIDNIANSANDESRSGITSSVTMSNQDTTVIPDTPDVPDTPVLPDTPDVQETPVLPMIPEPEPQMPMPEAQIGQAQEVEEAAQDLAQEVSEAIVPQYDKAETNVDTVLQRHYDNLDNTSTDSESQATEVNVPEYDVPEYDVPEYETEDLVGRSIDTSVPKATPVYDFWHSENEDHTFHMGEPWDGEEIGHVQFFAYQTQVPGTDPVYKFWNGDFSEYTFHLGDPWEGEIKQGVAFYAYRDDREGMNLIPVQVYWNDAQMSHTFHAGDPNPGEVKKGEIAFYAMRWSQEEVTPR